MASVIVGFEGGVSAQVHLDYLTVPYRRSLEVYGDTGTILWDDNAHTLRIYTKKEGRWRTERVAKKDATTPVILKNELTHFFDCIHTGRTPINSLENSFDVMRLIQKINDSASTNKTVKL